MVTKRFAIASLMLLCSAVQAEIKWTQSFEMPGPTPSGVDQLETDDKGSLYAVVREKRTEVWKWNSSGAKVFEAPVEARIVFGTHGDYFSYDDFGISRYSRESGALLWHQQPQHRIIDLKVDQAGQPYLRFFVNGPGYWEKHAYSTGNRVWTRGDGQIVMLDGPDLLFQDALRVQLVSKEDGRTTKILDAPVAKATISGYPTSKGGAIVSFATNKGSEIFGYRKGGLFTRLTLAGSPIGIAKDGSVIVRTNEEVLRIDGDFRRIWSQSAPEGSARVDRNFVYFATNSQIDRLQVDDGSIASPLILPENFTTDCAEHSGRIVVSSSNLEIGRLRYFDSASGALVDEWKSTSQGRPVTFVATAATMPNGDLIAVTYYNLDLSVARISATGDLIWGTSIPRMGAIWNSYGDGLPKSSIQVSSDGSAISIYTRGDYGDQGAELDPATGAVNARFPGHQIVSGNFAFRTTKRGTQAFTSKFDRTTGKELWRIPRTGQLTLDGKGSIYVGSSKNRISDGQLIWALPITITTMAVRDGRVFFFADGKGVGCADEESGAILWSDYLNFVSGYANKSAEISFDDGMVLFRPGGDDTAFAFSPLDGSRLNHGPYGTHFDAAGVKIQSGYYRPGSWVGDYVFPLTRTAGFFRENPVEVGTISFVPRQFVACPTGGFYILGDGRTGFSVAHWQ